MSFAKRHNKERMFDVDTEGLEYFKPVEAYASYGKNAVYKVEALYINKGGKYDDAPVAVVSCEGVQFMLNLPAHTTTEVTEILSSREDIDDIKAGKVGLKLYPYHSKTYNKDCYGVTWVDLI